MEVRADSVARPSVALTRPRRAWKHVRNALSIYGRALLVAVRSFNADRIPTHAYALTFRTLLALIPFLAVLFSLFKAFGGLDSAARALQTMVFNNLAPGPAGEVSTYVWTFVDRASAGAMGTLGVAILIVVVISLLTVIEQTFNGLWNIDRVRPLHQRFIVYWAMVTVAPIFFAISTSLTSAAQSAAILSSLQNAVDGRWLMGPSLSLLPWLVTCAGMMLLYLIMPNTRVRWWAALGGGLLAGTLWELGKVGFTWISKALFDYNAVYGSFGALPAFLVWLQLAWIIVLLGCKVTYAIQNAEALRVRTAHVRTVDEVGQGTRELLSVLAAVEVVRSYQRGEAPPTAAHLATGSGAPLEIMEPVLNRLVKTGFLVRVADCAAPSNIVIPDKATHGEGFLPARDPGSATVQELLEALRREPEADEEVDVAIADRPAATFVRGILERAATASGEVTGRLTLAAAAQHVQETEASP